MTSATVSGMVNIPEPFLTTAQDLHESEFKMMNTWRDIAMQPDLPRWYGVLLSSLAWMLNGEPVEYVTASRQDGDTLARVVVFTGTRIILSDVAEGGDVVPIAYPRERIKAIGVQAETSVFGSRDPFESWPGDLRVVVVHEDAPVVALPLDQSPRSRGRLPGLTEALRDSIGPKA
ncbi:hypothetical protein HII28_02115 [Planctomonas sp. JC2975]|uniref:hypothetical protein n=1 Tax=Planctomonas sp. JC2975 TaxID=2729626 RepID=UPI001475476F|nr:hypothetical protein [Planctomonas sp. JC2975]NNC10682.1 hypothetical protein [Planctomonas sp. JC2975]